MTASLPFEVPDTPGFTGGEKLFISLLDDKQIDPAQREGLVKSMVALVNQSKTLRAELHAADAQGYQIKISPNLAGKTDTSAKVIWLPNQPTPQSFSDANTVSTTDPASGYAAPVSPAGRLVGVLSHEVSHALDKDYIRAFGSEARSVAGVFGEGKAIMNNFIAGEEVRQANGGKLTIEERGPIFPSPADQATPRTEAPGTKTISNLIEYYKYINDSSVSFGDKVATTSAGVSRSANSVDGKPYLDYYGVYETPNDYGVSAKIGADGAESLTLTHPNGASRTLEGPKGHTPDLSHVPVVPGSTSPPSPTPIPPSDQPARMNARMAQGGPTPAMNAWMKKVLNIEIGTPPSALA